MVNDTKIWPKGIGFACLALATAFQILCIIQPVSFLIDVIFVRDDAFYFFEVAHRVASGGPASFDGIHATNGVQLLWHYMMVALAYLVPDKISFLYATLGLCVALNVLAGALLWDLGRRLGSVLTGDIALILWAGIMVERWNTLQGMEFSLHILLIVATLILLWEIWRGDVLRPAQMAFLGLLLSLNVWARLDGALYSVVFWAFAVWLIWYRRPPAQLQLAALLGVTAIPAVAALGYFWSNYAMAETLLPISGAAKGHYASVFFEGVDGVTAFKERLKWGLKIQSMIASGLTPDAIYEFKNYANFNLSNPGHLALPFLVLLGVLGGGLWLWTRTSPGDPLRAAIIGGVTLWALSIDHSLLTIWALGDFSHVSRHYYGVLLVFWIIWAALLIASVLEALPRRFGQGVGAAFLGGSVLLYGAMGVQFLTGYTQETENYALIRMQLGEALSESLPSGAIIGSWNAGVLGYFSDLPVVNLDGLMNDRDFLEGLETGRSLGDYLEATGITHLVDHNGRDLTLRFGEIRDTQAEFRNGITWDDVEVLEKVGDIYVLKVKG